MSEAAKMAVEDKENQVDREESASAEESVSSELNEPRWAVVSFETCAAKDLTYKEAERLLKKLDAEKVSGLCVVTNEVAERVSGSQ